MVALLPFLVAHLAADALAGRIVEHPAEEGKPLQEERHLHHRVAQHLVVHVEILHAIKDAAGRRIMLVAAHKGLLADLKLHERGFLADLQEVHLQLRRSLAVVVGQAEAGAVEQPRLVVVRAQVVDIALDGIQHAGDRQVMEVGIAVLVDEPVLDAEPHAFEESDKAVRLVVVQTRQVELRCVIGLYYESDGEQRQLHARHVRQADDDALLLGEGIRRDDGLGWVLHGVVEDQRRPVLLVLV